VDLGLARADPSSVAAEIIQNKGEDAVISFLQETLVRARAVRVSETRSAALARPIGVSDRRRNDVKGSLGADIRRAASDILEAGHRIGRRVVAVIACG
jgi:hypothetical protein